MRIAIMGAGAMGSFLGGFLARAGCDINLINTPSEHAEAIKENGLTLLDGQEKHTIPVKIYTTPTTLEPVQLIILLVKAYNTEEAVKDALNLIGPETYLLSLQNGYGHHLIMSKYIDSERILLGSTSSGAYLAEPGQVRIAGKGETFIGAFSRTQPYILEGIRDVFNKAGLQCSISNDIFRIIWEKLIINVGINALTAITGLRNGQLLDFPELTQVLTLAVKEAVAVAMAKGIELSFPDPVEKVKEVARITAANKSSMLQDIERKRPTEIKVINGAIVEMAKQVGQMVPVNQTLYNLVTVLEKKQG